MHALVAPQARLMTRTIEELRDLLTYMDVEVDYGIQDKEARAAPHACTHSPRSGRLALRIHTHTRGAPSVPRLLCVGPRLADHLAAAHARGRAEA